MNVIMYACRLVCIYVYILFDEFMYVCMNIYIYVYVFLCVCMIVCIHATQNKEGKGKGKKKFVCKEWKETERNEVKVTLRRCWRKGGKKRRNVNPKGKKLIKRIRFMMTERKGERNKSVKERRKSESRGSGRWQRGRACVCV